ncbi:MAG TPA: hypothetical protein VKS21_03180 [Spirochaetota bacterium]|nr:hypothetical protein [Spirochaetota bacterium]
MKRLITITVTLFFSVQFVAARNSNTAVFPSRISEGENPQAAAFQPELLYPLLWITGVSLAFIRQNKEQVTAGRELNIPASALSYALAEAVAAVSVPGAALLLDNPAGVKIKRACWGVNYIHCGLLNGIRISFLYKLKDKFTAGIYCKAHINSSPLFRDFTVYQQQMSALDSGIFFKKETGAFSCAALFKYYTDRQQQTRALLLDMFYNYDVAFVPGLKTGMGFKNLTVVSPGNRLPLSIKAGAAYKNAGLPLEFIVNFSRTGSSGFFFHGGLCFYFRSGVELQAGVKAGKKQFYYVMGSAFNIKKIRLNISGGLDHYNLYPVWAADLGWQY